MNIGSVKMLDNIIELTNSYINQMPKKERKKYGQFFTSKETAVFMSDLYEISEDVLEISILDAGAGSGILSCAFLERIAANTNIRKVELTCYENDENILPLLKSNLDYMKHNLHLELSYKILKENYITSQYLDFNNMIGGNEKPVKYDVVIGNPPYMKIPKNAPEATAMPKVCYGAPNMYFL